MHFIGVLIDQTSEEILNANQVDVFVGIDKELVLKQDILVFPNPTSSSTNVSFRLSKPEQVQLKVYNMLGKITYYENSKLYNSGDHQIVISADKLTNGIYFVELTVGNKKITQKLSVSK